MSGRAAAFALAFAVALAPLGAAAQSGFTRTPVANEDHSERIVRATVVLIAGGQVRGRGVVLGDDGRIATASAVIGSEREVTVRFANGRTQAAFVVANDPLWGITLIQPRGGRWPSGLPLATNARGNTPVRWVTGDEPHSVPGALRRRRTYVGAGGELQRDAWELDAPPADASSGSGIANAAGELVGIVVPPDPSVESGGAPALFGVPISVVQTLLQNAGNTARPWLGLLARTARPGDTAALALNGLRVIDVTHASPADRAGIHAGRPGDTIVGTPDRDIHTVEDLGAVLEPLHPGDTLTLRIVRGGSANPMDVAIHLAEFPPLAP